MTMLSMAIRNRLYDNIGSTDHFNFVVATIDGRPDLELTYDGNLFYLLIQDDVDPLIPHTAVGIYNKLKTLVYKEMYGTIKATANPVKPMVPYVSKYRARKLDF